MKSYEHIKPHSKDMRKFLLQLLNNFIWVSFDEILYICDRYAIWEEKTIMAELCLMCNQSILERKISYCPHILRYGAKREGRGRLNIFLYKKKNV